MEDKGPGWESQNRRKIKKKQQKTKKQGCLFENTIEERKGGRNWRPHIRGKQRELTKAN